MQVRSLDHLNLSVRSFDETVAWYGRVFGFELVEQDVLEEGQVRWGVIKSGDAMLCIYEYPEREHVDRFERARRGQHGINHFALRITDRQAWLDTIEREALELGYGGLVEYPHSDSWYVQDPTGYQIEVALWDDDEPRFAPPVA